LYVWRSSQFSVSVLKWTPYRAFALHNDFSHNVYAKGKLVQVFKLMLNILSLGSQVMLKVVMDLLETSRSVVQKYLKI
jgi:uncharacterized metal-binding protein